MKFLWSILVAVLVVDKVLGVERAQATNVVDAAAKSLYFNARRYVNTDAPHSEFYLTLDLKHWLQLHRAIGSQPRLAHKFRHQPATLKAQSLPGTSLWAAQLRQLGLTPGEIQHQPTYVYTWRISSFTKPAALNRFVRLHWLRHHLQRQQIYRRRSKTFKLFIDSADVIAKEDPLYSEPIVIRGQSRLRLCYGIYASIEDAQQDRRILAHHFVSPLHLLHHALTEALVKHVWLEPVAGYYFDKVEELSAPYPT